MVFLAMGRDDEGFEALEQADAAHELDIPGLRFAPALNRVRSAPRYSNLIKRLTFLLKMPPSLESTSSLCWRRSGATEQADLYRALLIGIERLKISDEHCFATLSR